MGKCVVISYSLCCLRKRDLRLLLRYCRFGFFLFGYMMAEELQNLAESWSEETSESDKGFPLRMKVTRTSTAS
jgi:hypothetical protein